MHRALVGDLHQPLPLRVIEGASQLDVAIDVTDQALGGLALGAVLGVNTRVPQHDPYPFSGQPLRAAAHPHCHRGVQDPSAANSRS